MTQTSDRLDSDRVRPEPRLNPSPDSVDDSVIARALQEYRLALEVGSPPSREGFLKRFPKIAGELAACLDALEFVRQAGSQFQSSAPGVGDGVDDFRPEGPLGDFRLVREIGRGGMGVVYEAVQISLGRRVALKVLPFAAALDAKQLQRFKNEAQAAAYLHYQNIVPVYFVGCERGVHYYAMQFIEGQTLAALIADLRQSHVNDEGRMTNGERSPNDEARKSRGPAGRNAPSPDDTPLGLRHSTCDIHSSLVVGQASFFRTVAQLGVQAALALEHAHQLGVVHRDIKPANLLVDGRGKLWITDFGLAHCQSQAGLTMSGDLLGTLRYMSPEQALAQPAGVDHRTDLYSLGATLYELLTLAPAFNGCGRQELLRQIAFEEPKPPRRLNRAVPAELETVVLKAMAKNPAERYRTAQELADDLERFLKDEPIRARRPTLAQRSRKWARRHRPVVWSAAVSLLVALAALGGSVGWIVRDQAARQVKIVTEAQAALEEAQRFRSQGKWQEAKAAAQRAEALLAGGGSPELRQSVGDLLADLDMAARLEKVRFLGNSVKDGHFDSEEADREYQEAFNHYGIDVATLDPREAAERIAGRSIRVELAAGLDAWAQRRRWISHPDGKSWRDLLALARAADPEPQRTALRDAVLRRDRHALAEWAASGEVCTLPPETLALLAEYLQEMGGSNEARVLLRKAQEQYPGDFWINHTLGQYLVGPGTPRWQEALPFYTAAVALRPDSPGARLNLGNALGGIGRLDAALASYRKAIDLKPDYAQAHCNVGIALWQLGKQEEAVAALRHALELKPDLREALSALGIALSRKGQLDEAEAALRKALKLKPNSLDAHNLGEALGKMNRLREAAAAYRQAIALKPDDAEAHCNLGVILGRMGQVDQEITAFRQAVKFKPNLFRANYNLGIALQNRGQLEEAVATFRRVSELKPRYAEPHYDLGNALWKQSRRDEAVAAYRRAISLKPDFAEAHCNLGLVLRQQGQLGQALAALKQGHELGARRRDWSYPSAQWVRECQRLVELDGREEAVLRGQAGPINAGERNEYAQLCYCKRRYLAAARLWADAFTADPKLADDLRAGHRNEAAYAAALAAAGQGTDAALLDDQQRARWRKQAVQWLRAELAGCTRLLESRKPEDRQLVQQRLQSWRCDEDLATLRDLTASPKKGTVPLSANEREACSQLWGEVEALRAGAERP